jgi:hypothetical protein
MELVSKFSEVRSIYYEFYKDKPISKINKKRKTVSSDTWQHQSVPRGMLTSS